MWTDLEIKSVARWPASAMLYTPMDYKLNCARVTEIKLFNTPVRHFPHIYTYSNTSVCCELNCATAHQWLHSSIVHFLRYS